MTYPAVLLTHTIRQTEVFELLDIWVTNTPYVKMLSPHEKKVASPYIFLK
jgi:hypothetical protein